MEESEETFTWQPPRTELGISKFGKKFEARLPKNWVKKRSKAWYELNSSEPPMKDRQLPLCQSGAELKQNCMGGLRCSYIRRQLLATAKWYYYYHDHQGMPTKKLMTFRSPAPLNPLKHTNTRCYPLDSGRNLVRMPLSFSPHIRLLY